MNYDLPIQLKSSIKESYLFSYEIINDILNTKFGFFNNINKLTKLLTFNL